MAKTVQQGRLLLVTAVVTMALGALGYRLVDLQAIRHDELRILAQHNTQKVERREPLRGQIKDIRGNLLATSVPVKTVCADATLVGTRQAEVARVLAPLLQTNELWLAERLKPKIRMENGRAVTNSYVVLKRKVPVETWQQIEQAMTNLRFGFNEKKLTKAERVFYRTLKRKAIFAEDDQVRDYPNHVLAAHVLGFVKGDESQNGASGIEAAFNAKLSGIRGWRRTETDIRKREMVAYREQDVEPQDGMNVVLTLDVGLQYIVETELADAMIRHTPLSVCATVVRPRTGEVLAMATLPNFDPNFPGQAAPEHLRNRVIGFTFEPGSTFKTVVISGALNESVVKMTDQFNCDNGTFHFAGRSLHDHERYGVLSVEHIITKSSNIGAAKIGIQMGETRLYQYMSDFGFGRATGIQLPAEERGIMHPLKDWSKVSIAQIPMGQGVAVTPMQMVMAVSAIANQGRLMRPTLVNRLEDPDGRLIARYEPVTVRRVISEDAARQMVGAMKTVVSPEGTAVKATLENYTAAGKTGTAQKAEPGGYSKTRYFASFVGFFPADNPELCILVVFDEPKNGHQGGQCAAPVFRNIAERAAHYLNIRPEIKTEGATNNTMTAAAGLLPAGWRAEKKF